MLYKIEDIDYRHLSDAQCLLLAQRLIANVASKDTAALLTPEQIEEFDRSFEAVQRGEEATYSWEQVHAELLAGQ